MDIPQQKLIVALAAAVLTAACGGGGGGAGGPAPAPAPAPTPTPPPPPAPGTFNAQQAWKNFLTTSNTWTVTGTGNDGNVYTIALATTPGGAQLFPVNGTSYATATASAQQRVGGLTIHQSNSITYYDSAFTTVGTRSVVDANPAKCSVALTSLLPPTSTAINTTGALQTFNDLNGCLPNSVSEGSSTTSWAVVTENNINYFCLNTVVRNLNGATVSTELDCVETAAGGTLGPKARISVEVTGGLSLVARN